MQNISTGIAFVLRTFEYDFVKATALPCKALTGYDNLAAGYAT